MQDRVILVQEEPRGPSQLVEIPVGINGLARVPFPDIQQLRSDTSQIIVIKAMRLITADVLTHGMINAGVTAPVAELQKISVVLYAEGWEKGQLIPLLTFNDMTLPAGTIPHRYHQQRLNNWEKVDWSKSYLQFANGTVSANAPYVVMFDVEYTRLRLDAQAKEYVEIVGPN